MYCIYDNRWIEDGTITARTEADSYEATNLTEHNLFPGWRSCDRALALNGTNEYAYVADHADFDITGDFTAEALVKLKDISGVKYIIHKWSSNLGYIFFIIGGELFLQLDTGSATSTDANLVAGVWYRLKAVYDASASTVTMYKDGVALSVTPTSVPSSITANAIRLTVGTNNTAASGFFGGEISYAGIDNAEHDHGGYLDPSLCAGYWGFSDDLTDSSGNSHTLTGSGINSGNYSSMTAYEWVQCELGTTTDPTKIVIPRNHNLTSSAVVKLLKGDVYSGYSVAATLTVAADTAIVADISSSTDTKWVLEINDPTNSDAYVAIPYISLGSEDMTLVNTAVNNANFTFAYTYAPRHANISNKNQLGNRRTYNIAKTIQTFSGEIRPIVGNLATTSGSMYQMRQLLEQSMQGKPVVWCFDDGSSTYESAYTFLVYVESGMGNIEQFEFNTIVSGSANDNEASSVFVRLVELAEEA